MKTFMTWATAQTIMPTMHRTAPTSARYLRPRRSDIDPTKGQTLAIDNK